MVDLIDAPRTGLDTASRTAGRQSTSMPAYLDTAVAGEALTNIRGRSDRSLAFADVIRGEKLSPEQIAKLQTIYDTAKDLPLGENYDKRTARERNCGQDLKKLLPMFRENPELLNKLHALAKAETLFSTNGKPGVTPDGKSESAEDFARRKADYLVDVIRHSVDTSELVQGPNAMCTYACALSMIARDEFLRLACDYGVDGKVKTKGGKEMVALEEYHPRSVASSTEELKNIRSIRPSAGMLNLISAVDGLVVPKDSAQTGAYWYQYTRACEHLTGEKQICAGENAHITDKNDGSVSVDVKATTGSTRSAAYVIDRVTHSGDQIQVDLEWSHAGAYTGADTGEHGRHALIAKGVEYRAPDGSELSEAERRSGMNVESFIVCKNPIGKFVHQKTGTTYAEGTRLGSSSDDEPWFIVGKDGTALIREDVFNRHLRTAVVSTGEKFVYDPETDMHDRPVGVGIADDGEIYFVRVVEEPANQLKEDSARKLVTESRGTVSRDITPAATSPKSTTPDRNVSGGSALRGRVDRTGRFRYDGAEEVEDAAADVGGYHSTNERNTGLKTEDANPSIVEATTKETPTKGDSRVVSHALTWGIRRNDGYRSN